MQNHFATKSQLFLTLFTLSSNDTADPGHNHADYCIGNNLTPVDPLSGVND
jgi:hypothetical protein